MRAAQIVTSQLPFSDLEVTPRDINLAMGTSQNRGIPLSLTERRAEILILGSRNQRIRIFATPARRVLAVEEGTNMPMYMDRHYVEGATRPAVADAPQKDLALQDKYNVKFLTYSFR